MLITLKVPSIACSVCAKTITEGISKHDPESQTKVDVENKIVTVETSCSESAIRDLIVSLGHELA